MLIGISAYSQRTCTLQTIQNVSPGAVVVDLSMSNYTDSLVTAFQWSIGFDPAVLSFDPATGITDWFANVSGVGIQSPTPGKITFVWGDTPVAINGVLCKIHFTYIGNMNCSDLTFTDSPTPRLVANGIDYGEYRVTYVNGQVCGLGVGVDENSVNPAVEIYPTVAKTSVNVKYSVPESGRITIGIYNMIGDEIQKVTNTVTANNEYTQEINVSDLSAGVYFVKYQIATNSINTIKTEKITVTR